MKAPPIRIIALALLPITVLLFWISLSFNLIVELDQETISWEQLQEELHQKTWNEHKIQINLDNSVFFYNKIGRDSIDMHLIPKKNISNSMDILRTSPTNFWVHASFDSVRDKKTNVLTDVAKGTSTRISLGKLPKTEQGALLAIVRNVGLSEITPNLNRIIARYYRPVTTKLWKKEFFILNSLASFLFVSMGFIVVIFTLKDIAMLGYTTKMKMMHWWHYFFFLPKTAKKMKKHFNREKDRLIEEKKCQLLVKFKRGVKLPKKIYIPKLKEILYSKDEDTAKKHCLMKVKAWNFAYLEARNFLLDNFYDFFKFNSNQRKTIIWNLHKVVSFENITLETLSIKKETTNGKRIFLKLPSVKTDDRREFIDILDEKFHWQYYEYEDLISSLNHTYDLIPCFVTDIELSYKNIQLKRVRMMLDNLHLENTNEYMETFSKFSDEDIEFSLSILFQLNELKLRWDKRDKYLKILIEKKFWRKELSALFDTKRHKIINKLQTVFSPIHEKSSDFNISGKRFLIVSDYMSDKQEFQLSEIFQKYGAEIVVLHGVTRSRPRVDYVLLLTSLMSHGTGSFYKHSGNRLYIPYMNGERIIKYLQSMI